MTDKHHWANGSLELLNHGLNHIKEGKEFDFRIAMISIDNSVELSIKTYFSQNRRSLNLSRKDLQQSKRYFPQLLDIFGNNNRINISNEDLDAIEFYHSIRNNLYHEGAGINVQENIVKAYYALAYDLISKLFSLNEITKPIVRISYEELDGYEDIEEFYSFYNSVESSLRDYIENYKNRNLEKVSFIELVKIAQDIGIVSINEYEILLKVLQRRNDIAHRASIPSKDDIIRDIYFLDDILKTISEYYDKERERKIQGK